LLFLSDIPSCCRRLSLLALLIFLIVLTFSYTPLFTLCAASLPWHPSSQTFLFFALALHRALRRITFAPTMNTADALFQSTTSGRVCWAGKPIVKPRNHFLSSAAIRGAPLEPPCCCSKPLSTRGFLKAVLVGHWRINPESGQSRTFRQDRDRRSDAARVEREVTTSRDVGGPARPTVSYGRRNRYCYRSPATWRASSTIDSTCPHTQGKVELPQLSHSLRCRPAAVDSRAGRFLPDSPTRTPVIRASSHYYVCLTLGLSQ